MKQLAKGLFGAALTLGSAYAVVNWGFSEDIAYDSRAWEDSYTSEGKVSAATCRKELNDKKVSMREFNDFDARLNCAYILDLIDRGFDAKDSKGYQNDEFLVRQYYVGDRWGNEVPSAISMDCTSSYREEHHADIETCKYLMKQGFSGDELYIFMTNDVAPLFTNPFSNDFNAFQIVQLHQWGANSSFIAAMGKDFDYEKLQRAESNGINVSEVFKYDLGFCLDQMIDMAQMGIPSSIANAYPEEFRDYCEGEFVYHGDAVTTVVTYVDEKLPDGTMITREEIQDIRGEPSYTKGVLTGSQKKGIQLFVAHNISPEYTVWANSLTEDDEGRGLSPEGIMWMKDVGVNQEILDAYARPVADVIHLRRNNISAEISSDYSCVNARSILQLMEAEMDCDLYKEYSDIYFDYDNRGDVTNHALLLHAHHIAPENSHRYLHLNFDDAQWVIENNLQATFDSYHVSFDPSDAVYFMQEGVSARKANEFPKLTAAYGVRYSIEEIERIVTGNVSMSQVRKDAKDVFIARKGLVPTNQ